MASFLRMRVVGGNLLSLVAVQSRVVLTRSFGVQNQWGDLGEVRSHGWKRLVRLVNNSFPIMFHLNFQNSAWKVQATDESFQR